MTLGFLYMLYIHDKTIKHMALLKHKWSHSRGLNTQKKKTTFRAI